MNLFFFFFPYLDRGKGQCFPFTTKGCFIFCLLLPQLPETTSAAKNYLFLNGAPWAPLPTAVVLGFSSHLLDTGQYYSVTISQIPGTQRAYHEQQLRSDLDQCCGPKQHILLEKKKGTESNNYNTEHPSLSHPQPVKFPRKCLEG